MSYPGYLTNSTNVPADVSTQRSVGTFSFQLNTGAAQNESTLQSPAAITQDANGNVSLTMAAAEAASPSILTMSGISTALNMTSQGGQSTLTVGGSGGAINVNGAGDATITVVGGQADSSGPTSSTLILGSTSALGVNDIIFGNPTTTGIALFQTTANPGTLQVGNNFTGVNIASFDQNTNNIVLGKQAVEGNIDLNGAVAINLVGGTNGIGLAPTSATNSIISQTIASGGSLGLGSSLEFPQTLRVSDVPYLGADCYVEIFGPPATIPLFLSAAQGPAGECGIHPDTVDTSGQLLLGSDNTNVSAIRIAHQATTINNLGGAPQVLLAQTTIASNASGTIPTPTGEGLYAIMGCSAGPGSTGQSRQGQVNVMAYVNSTGRIQMGGSGYADLGSIGGSDAFVLFPNDGLATMFYQNNSSQAMVNYSIVAFKISGPILGTF
jgi:hypothetical protein